MQTKTKKLLIIASIVSVASIGAAFAQQTFTAWGHEYDITPFAPQQMMIAVATDRKTGKKFNILKSKSGKMMIISPMDVMKGSPTIASEDMF